MSIRGWLVACVALTLIACGARTELLEDAPSAQSGTLDAGARTRPDAGSAPDAGKDAAPPPSDASVDAAPPFDASADAAPPADAASDAAPPDDGGRDGGAGCGMGAVELDGVCLVQSCAYGKQGLACVLADGSRGHCLGVTCSNLDLLTDSNNCGVLGGVCPKGADCVGGHCFNDAGATTCNDADCPAGYRCETSFDAPVVCVVSECDAAHDNQACAFTNNPGQPGWPQFCCGSACIDLMDDSKNCGYCGHACPGNATCLDGVCGVDCAHSPDNTVCDGDFGFCCGGACVEHFNNDDANCNACGAICPSATSCRVGSCSQKSCFESGAACAAGETCVAQPALAYDVCARDQCPALAEGTLCAAVDASGEAHAGSCCSATCSNLQTDAKNCGACDHACSSGDVCTNGACSPKVACANATDGSVCQLASGDAGECCGGSCVNVETDSENCTGCGLACPLGSTCRAVAGRFSIATCQDLSGTAKTCTDASSCPTGYGCGQSPAGLCQPTSCTDSADGSPCYLPNTAQEKTQCCGGTCTNLSFDSDNCGACGAACPSGSACESQACFIAGTGFRAVCTGTAAGVCPSGTTCSVGQNGAKCAPDACAGRGNGDLCALASGKLGTCCEETCVATASDSKNCGSCGNDCGGDPCLDFVCEREDARSCSPACPTGLVCHQGACYGPVCGDQKVCLVNQDNPLYFLCGTGPYCAGQDSELGFCCGDDSCVDPANDAQNCGGCGVVCGAGEACRAGACH